MDVLSRADHNLNKHRAPYLAATVTMRDDANERIIAATASKDIDALIAAKALFADAERIARDWRQN